MDTRLEAEVAALRIILSNMVARMAGVNDDAGRAMLSEMADQSKLAAEHMSVGPDRASLVRDTQVYLDEFFKGITIN
jgi:hypothetical protein